MGFLRRTTVFDNRDGTVDDIEHWAWESVGDDGFPNDVVHWIIGAVFAASIAMILIWMMFTGHAGSVTGLFLMFLRLAAVLLLPLAVIVLCTLVIFTTNDNRALLKKWAIRTAVLWLIAAILVFLTLGLNPH